MSRGIIEKALSGFYYVNTGTRMVACRARGRFRKEKISPLVGDWVQVQELSDGSGSVEAIEPRKCAFLRPAVANICLLYTSMPRGRPCLSICRRLFPYSCAQRYYSGLPVWFDFFLYPDSDWFVSRCV